jgi:hypothetical protein
MMMTLGPDITELGRARSIGHHCLLGQHLQKSVIEGFVFQGTTENPSLLAFPSNPIEYHIQLFLYNSSILNDHNSLTSVCAHRTSWLHISSLDNLYDYVLLD